MRAVVMTLFRTTLFKEGAMPTRRRKHNSDSCGPDSISFNSADVADDEFGNRSPNCLVDLECKATRTPSPSSEL